MKSKLLVLIFLICLTLTNIVDVAVRSEPVNGEIPDFEFDDTFAEPSKRNHKSTRTSFVLDDFDDFFIDDDEDVEPEYDIVKKEKKIQRTLFKALADKELKYKFSEVIPLLRNLNKQQRMVFASIISAQLSGKGKRLKFEEVRRMFGNDKPLLLPIVYDLANLVHEGFLRSDKHQEHERGDSNQFLRRSFTIEKLNPSKTRNDQRAIREMDFSAPESSMKAAETLHVDIDDEPKIRKTDESFDAIEPQPLMQVLNASYKKAVAEKSSALTYRLPKVEIISQPKSLSMEDIENRALAEINGTYDAFVSDGNGSHLLPQPLINRFNRPHIKSAGPNPERCERFTGGICLNTQEYPMAEIMGSIKRHRYAMEALLAEYRDKTAELEQIDYLGDPTADLSDLRRRRQSDDNGSSPGSMCASIIRYARPQKARSATGEWKYIVNTGEHTQTLRLEKCSQPLEPCSYLTENFESSCTQVYNYHRLLSWDNERGLHVDIFKVPTCCSCHLVGYKEAFPPLSQPSNSLTNSNTRKGVNNFDSFSSASTNKDLHYSTLGSDDFDEEDDSNIAYQFGNGFQRVKPKREKEKDRRRKPSFPETYLTPPSNGQSLISFSNRPRQRTPTIKRKQFDQRDASVHETDLKIARVTVSPPKFSQANRPRKVTPPISSSVDSRINIRLPNAATDRKRINYNYHPIIDFFEDDEDESMARTAERKTGKFADHHDDDQEENWRPVVGGKF